MKFSEFREDPNKQYEKIKKENPKQVQNLEELMEKYKGLSKQELMQEFLKESKKQKQNGELDKNKIENIKKTLTPFLDNNQQQNLQNLMDLINND